MHMGSSAEQLHAENAELREQLTQAQDLLGAIRRGEVDALVIDSAAGPRIFALQGLDAESNRMRGEILAQVSDAVIAVDGDRRVTYLNAAAERQYGVSASRALGLGLGEIYTSRWHHAGDEEAARAALETRGAWRGENTHLLRDGRELLVESSVTLLRDGSGSVAGELAIISEITERRRTEQALRVNEERLRLAHQKLESVLSSITDGMLVLDRDWRYSYFNEPGARLLGMGPDDLIGESIWDIFPHTRNSKFYEAFHHAVTRGAPVHFEEYYPAPLNRWFECRCYPSAEGLTVFFQDITERRQAEAVLRQNSEMFARLIEQSPAGVYVVDAQFQMRQVNAVAAPVFASVNPLIGRDFDEVMQILWGPEVGARIADIFRHTLATGERYISPRFSEQRHDLGVEQAYEWETQRVSMPDGSHGVVCYFRDVTELERIQMALQDADRRKDEFLATLAHEFGTHSRRSAPRCIF